MAITFTNGKIYRFINNKYSEKALNVYGTNAASTGRNVCLYTDTPSDVMQQWKYSVDTGVGVRLHSTVNNNYVLDRSDGSISGSANNNAHLCAVGSTSARDSALSFVHVSGNTYRIRLASRVNNAWLFLTAANGNGSPASSITTSNITTANGNVYWAEEAVAGTTAYDKQCWNVEEVGGSSGDPSTGSGQKLRMPINGVNVLSASRTTDYDSSYYSEYNALHYGGDIACALGTELKGLGTGTVEEIGENVKEGKFVCVRYNSCIPVDGGDARDIIIRYFHMNTVDVAKNDGVTTSVILGTSGCSGDWAFNAKHVHIEVDTDVNYPNYTPSIPSGHAGGNLYAGTDTCLNPFDWFYSYDGQSKSRYSGSDDTWVFPNDMTEHTP